VIAGQKARDSWRDTGRVLQPANARKHNADARRYAFATNHERVRSASRRTRREFDHEIRRLLPLLIGDSDVQLIPTV
jgi:hypothetical protein